MIKTVRAILTVVDNNEPQTFNPEVLLRYVHKYNSEVAQRLRDVIAQQGSISGARKHVAGIMGIGA